MDSTFGRVFTAIGFVLLVASVGQLTWILGGVGVRAVRSWIVVARHARRAATARAEARASRERFVREQATEAYATLRRASGKNRE